MRRKTRAGTRWGSPLRAWALAAFAQFAALSALLLLPSFDAAAQSVAGARAGEVHPADTPTTSVPAPSTGAPSTGAAINPAFAAARTRWQKVLAAFAAADQAQPPRRGGVLFVGSSSLRLWSGIRDDFPRLPGLINRGFGGSTLWECSFFVREWAERYRPRQVVVYAGDNDLAQGRTPQQVLESFDGFTRAVRSALPAARISFISIKPSPARERLLPQIRRANLLVAAWTHVVPNTEFIDVFTPMLDDEGRPRAELFRPDRLHLNQDGYRLWHAVIAPYVPEAGAALAEAAKQVPGGPTHQSRP